MNPKFLSILLLAVGVCAFVAAAEINPRCAPHEDIEDRCNFGMKRFYFNGTQCVEFTYGGCANIANKYVTQKSCEKTCMPDSDRARCVPYKNIKETCPGPLEMYHFDGKNCIKFSYGGCGGIANVYQTRAGCKKTCKPNSGSNSKVKPARRGDNSNNINKTANVNKDNSHCVPVENFKKVCPGPLDMYHFNGKECVKFSYGGCGGMENVYQTQTDCKKSCMPDTSCVPHRGETGRCRGLFNMYYFNGTKCVEFTYGGCGGNDNIYETQKKCEDKCVPFATMPRPN